ncbi:MAG TPA: 50S ribosomal protein L21 [Anaerolineaceae bacterium]|nr:50S ribosomal protein L21 [Anaerolineaceae bacterium]
MLYAIFESGGKQFKATEGAYVEVDHLPAEVGKKISLDKVLLLVNEKDTQVGTPFIKGASVDATVISHFKAKKIIVFKYRAKERYRVKTGHRQQYTRLMVDSIAFTGKAKAVEVEKPVEKVEEKKPAAKPSASAKATTAKKTTSTTKPAASAKKTTSTAKTAATKTKTSAAKSTTAKKTTSSAAKTTAKPKPAAKTDKKK